MKVIFPMQNILSRVDDKYLLHCTYFQISNYASFNKPIENFNLNNFCKELSPICYFEATYGSKSSDLLLIRFGLVPKSLINQERDLTLKKEILILIVFI